MDELDLTARLTLPNETPSKLIQSVTVNTGQPDHFVPPFPLRVMQEIVAAKAEKALPLILAIHRQISMTGRETAPLNAAIWNAAGNPSAREREGIIKKLKSLPQIVAMNEERTPMSRYRVGKGPIWVKPTIL